MIFEINDLKCCVCNNIPIETNNKYSVFNYRCLCDDEQTLIDYNFSNCDSFIHNICLNGYVVYNDIQDYVISFILNNKEIYNEKAIKFETYSEYKQYFLKLINLL